MQPTTRDPLILELVAALGAGRVTVGPIHDDEEFVHGLARPDGRIQINLAVSAVDTALHELLHRMRPTWSERAVRSRVGRMMRQLSDREIDTLYTVLLSTAHARKKAVSA